MQANKPSAADIRALTVNESAKFPAANWERYSEWSSRSVVRGDGAFFEWSIRAT